MLFYSVVGTEAGSSTRYEHRSTVSPYPPASCNRKPEDELHPMEMMPHVVSGEFMKEGTIDSGGVSRDSIRQS